MTAAEVLHELRRRGYQVEPDDDDAVQLRGPGPPPAELLAAIRQRKVEILALLRPPRRLVAIEYDCKTRMTTRIYSDGTKEP